MTELSEWVPVSEAARLTGLSVRTIKRMAEEGKLKSSKTPGLHARILRADLDKLARPPGAATASAAAPASVLTAKREEVETLGLELQAEHGRRELAKLHAQDVEAERERKEARRSERLVNRRALADVGLERERDIERRGQEQREAETQRRQAEFERRWILWAENRLFDWLTFEQRQRVLEMVTETVSARHAGDDVEMPDYLLRTIARFCAPWAAERQARAKREELIENALRGLPLEATDLEKLRAASNARVALSEIPLSASDIEVRAAVTAVVAPIAKAIKERRESEEARLREKQAREQAEIEESRTRDQAKNEKKRKAQGRLLHKAVLIASGVSRVDSYLTELFAEHEIERDDFGDFSWRAELKGLVRAELEATLTGESDENSEEVEQLAEELVDAELE